MCKQTNRTSLADYAICTEATNMCRDNVGMFQATILVSLGNTQLIHSIEGPYYAIGERGVYDIRHPYNVSNAPQQPRLIKNQLLTCVTPWTGPYSP